MEVIVRTISAERDHAREIIEAIIDSEQNYLFTNDLDYKENKQTIIIENNPNQPGQPGQQPGGPPPQQQQQQ